MKVHRRCIGCLVVMLWLSFQTNVNAACCQRHQESEFLAAYDTIVGDSYSKVAVSTSSMLDSCKDLGLRKGTHGVTLSESGSLKEVRSTLGCGQNCFLTIPAGVTLTVDTDLRVGVLEVEGNVIWSQTKNVQVI